MEKFCPVVKAKEELAHDENESAAVIMIFRTEGRMREKRVHNKKCWVLDDDTPHSLCLGKFCH